MWVQITPIYVLMNIFSSKKSSYLATFCKLKKTPHISVKNFVSFVASYKQIVSYDWKI